ncbi:MAG: ATP-binding protein [Spirochaetaceae bacterium]
MVFLLPPHHQNFNKRLVKTPKLYFYDTGLVCSLLGIRSAEQARTNPLRGALFENLIVAETVKAFTHHRLKPPVFFWRDQTGHEIDLLVEIGGQLYPVEIKSGQTVSGGMFDTLQWWCAQSGTTLKSAALVYGGNDTFTRKEIAVRPWFSV